MVFEIAKIEVKDGGAEEFEKGVTEAVPLFKRARGCKAMKLERSMEFPNRYRLVVQWETVEDHMIYFRESEDFQEWRRLVSPYFASPPEVEHMFEVVHGF